MNSTQSIDNQNDVFSLALDLVQNTDQHVFLTGKAGTGKTTFLKYLVDHCDKRMVVVAPTGVAAINAGGTTMHSQFNLPIEPLPYLLQSPGNYVFDTRSLFRNVRLANQKIEVLKEMELLVIDEISMVRADTLDLVDCVLRHYRHRQKDPFGGVQVLYIGDMFQLPPIVKPEEWEKLKLHYSGYFFFDSKVIQQVKPLRIELWKIYRQQDEIFIHLLNQVRNNRLQSADYEELDKRWNPTFEGADLGYITLCTHNRTADEINFRQLDKLPGKALRFFCEIEGDFNDRILPAEKELVLKVGARVMFIRNDTGEIRRFFNGKQATVTKIAEDSIFVDSGDQWGEFEVEKVVWENIAYGFDKEKDKITEEVLGTFSQFPLRLAWAITIHKSQGLTFEKAVIDAGQSFSAGQVYVALSRCTNLEGLVLKSRIQPSAIFTDSEIVEFSKVVHENETLIQILDQEKNPYLAKRMVKAFTMNTILEPLLAFQKMLPSKRVPDPEVAQKGIQTMIDNTKRLHETCLKTQNRLLELLNDPAHGPDGGVFKNKVKGAIGYFSTQIDEQILEVLKLIFNDLKIQKKVKGLLKQVIELRQTIEAQKKRIQKTKLGDQVFFVPEPQKNEPGRLEEPDSRSSGKRFNDHPKAQGTKEPKGSSNKATLQMFKEGKSPEEIASARGYAISTIESHLAILISEGKVELEEVLSKEKIDLIEPHLSGQHEAISANPVKAALGDAVSWGEIRFVINAWRKRNLALESQ